MLHCASVANVDNPLAFDAGLGGLWVESSATGTGVAQIQGWVCEPRSTGPPRGWLVIVKLAKSPLPGPWTLAVKTFWQILRRVSTVRKIPLGASKTKGSSAFLPSS